LTDFVQLLVRKEKAFQRSLGYDLILLAPSNISLKNNNNNKNTFKACDKARPIVVIVVFYGQNDLRPLHHCADKESYCKRF